MNFKFFVLASSVFILMVAFKQQTEKNSIDWDENRPLSWNDFRAKPQK